MDYLIKAGDKVTVRFNANQFTLCKGTVKYVPCSTGDSWIIEADNGKVHYISEGCTITKDINNEMV